MTKTRTYHEMRPTSDDFIPDEVDGWEELKYEKGRLAEQHRIEESSVYGRTEYIFLFGEDGHEETYQVGTDGKKYLIQKK